MPQLFFIWNVFSKKYVQLIFHKIKNNKLREVFPRQSFEIRYIEILPYNLQL